MTCPTCQPLAATTRAVLDRRLRDVRDHQSGFAKCPQCGGADWGITEDFIKPTKPSFERAPLQALLPAPFETSPNRLTAFAEFVASLIFFAVVLAIIVSCFVGALFFIASVFRTVL